MRELTPVLSKGWELYKRSLNAPVQMWVGAPFRLLRSYFYTSAQNKLARFARNAPAFDFGASTSLRQVVSGKEYNLFFQQLDERMYYQIMEKQILETAIKFLDAQQIDTTEFRQRAQTILNNGVISGGPIIGSNVMGKVTGGQVTNNF